MLFNKSKQNTIVNDSQHIVLHIITE